MRISLANRQKRVTALGLAIFIAIGAAGGPSNGQQDLDTLEHIQNLEKFEDVASELLLLADQITKTKKRKCMSAFGHEKFCTCLAEKSPVGVSFEDYILSATATKEDLNYSKLAPQDQLLIDNARKARDQCVAEANFPKILK